MISVALHPFGHVLLPEALPLHAASGILRQPLVVEFVHHEDAQPVAQFEEVLAIGIVGGADVVEAERLHHLQPLLDGTGIGCRTECAKRMVVGVAL